MESKISEANTHLFIFGWCENFLVGISCVYILSFNGRMESKISEANTHIIIFGWFENCLMGISVDYKSSDGEGGGIKRKPAKLLLGHRDCD